MLEPLSLLLLKKESLQTMIYGGAPLHEELARIEKDIQKRQLINRAVNLMAKQPKKES